MRRYLFLLSLFISLASFAEGRTPSDVQPYDVDTLAKMALHINYFNKVCPQEKVYLHLDNTAYFQGETIWYAANVVNASTGREAASKVLYVELLSPTGVILKQQKLKVVNGRCHGSFPLVDGDVKAAVDLRGAIGYPSGYYQIRAYTRAMLNFDDACVFSRVIPVYKAPEEEGDYENPIVAEYEGTERERPQLPRSERPKKMNVSFYPEGGHYIKGIRSRIAYKITDENGMGMDVDSIVDENGRRIPSTLMHKGMGAFFRKPGGGTEKVFFMKEGKRHSFDLPKPESKGCSVCIDVVRDEYIHLFIVGINIEQEGALGYTIINRGKVYFCDTLCFTPKKEPSQPLKAERYFPKKELADGINQFTLYNEEGTILAQRLFFVDNSIHSIPVYTEYDKETFLPFDSIALHLRTAQQSVSSFSLAVRDAADYGTAYRDDIRTYMLLSSELKGLIEEPGWYFEEETDGTRAQALDPLMMVQGWTRYNWRQMAGVEPFKIRHYTEEKLVVDGWAFSNLLKRSLPNTTINVRLYSPDRAFVQKTSVTTDSLGYWSVGLDDFVGDWDLFLSSKQPSIVRENATTRIRLERSSRPNVHAFRPEEIYLPNYKNEYPPVFAWQKDEKLKLEFFPDAMDNITSAYVLDEVVIEGKRRYIDYNCFRAFDADKDTEMELDEGNYTTDVAGYLESKGYSLEFDYNGDIPNYDHPGTYLDRVIKDVRIDGHTTISSIKRPKNVSYKAAFERSDPPRWWEYDMEKVKSVLVFGYEPEHRYVEVRIELKGIDEMKNTSKNYRETTFTGYTPVVEFYAPTYPKGPIPGDKDYRRTLYWNPEVTTDETGCATVSFYNNGFSRAFTVSAEGLTKEGIPIINQ